MWGRHLDDYRGDDRLRTELKQLVPAMRPEDEWSKVQERVCAETSAEHPGVAGGAQDEGETDPAGPASRWATIPPTVGRLTGRDRGRRSALAYAMISLAVLVLLAGVGTGIFEAVKHLGSGQPTLVITDDTVSPSTTEETTPTTAGEATTTPATVREAGEGTWQPVTVAIDGAPVRDLVVDPSDPSVLYAATDQGLFKSTDSAGHWVQLFADVALVIAVDPASPSSLYAITKDWEEPAGGDWVMLRSDDGGASWQVLDDTVPGSVISSAGSLDSPPGGFVFDTTTSPSRVYRYGSGLGLQSSTDRGETWIELIPPSRLDPVEAVALDPTHPGTIYASSDYGGALLMRSTDGGATWEELPPGLLGQPLELHGLGDLRVQLAIDPADPSRLYQAVRIALRDYSFAQSTDQGETWTDLEDAADERAVAVLEAGPGASADSVDALQALPGRDQVWWVPGGALYWLSRGVIGAATDDPPACYVFGGLGLHKSTDAGTTWNPANTGLGYSLVNTVVVDQASASTLYACTDQGIGKSVDGGRTWETIYAGTADQLLVAPSASSVLYAVTDEGLLRSDDGGATWGERGDESPPHSMPVMVAADSPDTLYAYWVGGGFSLGPPENAAYRSTDGGESWQPWAAGTHLSSLISAPSDSSVLYAAGTISSVDGTNLEDPSSGLLTSPDGGASWSYKEVPTDIVAITVDADDPSVLYIQCDGGTLYRSTDAGSTWREMEFEHIGDLKWIAADPQLPGVIYAASASGTEAHIYRSVDGGATWDHISGDWTPNHVVGDSSRDWRFAADLVADKPSEIAFYALKLPAGMGPDTHQLYKWVPRGGTDR